MTSLAARAYPRSRVHRLAAHVHVRGVGALLLLAVWLMHRFVFTSAIPAGTDTLGFVDRARENASWSQVLSVWDPASFGARRQFTMDNLLGAMTILTRDPLVTVKLLEVATLFAAGAFAYALSWSWYRRPVPALLAGVIYMTSQTSLSRWGSGQLNVEMAIAAAPLLVLLWSRCVDEFTLRRAVVFTFAASAVVLVRPDMALYTAPFLALYVLVRLVGGKGALVNALRTTAVALAGGAGISMIQLAPAFAGVRARWLSTGNLFDRQQLVDRSLDALSSLLGMGREIGYFGYVGQQTWFSHPWISFVLYQLLAAAVGLLALGALYVVRDDRAVYLAACIVLATFLAKGVRGPVGGPYDLGLHHLPVVGNLRGPNRWLLGQALGYAVLGGLGLEAAAGWLRRGVRHRARLALAALAAGYLLLLPVLPTLTSAFRTWQPRPSQLALLGRVAADPGDFKVATVPYDQTLRFVRDGSYQGYEHDLGAESPIWTGHPVLGDGGWNQQAADFVGWTSTLLGRGDPAFEPLLATVGVRYLVDFGYAATSPHLLPAALLGGPHKPWDGSIVQQIEVGHMPGLTPVARNTAGSVLRLRGAAPSVSFRPNVAVIVGGRSGLAAFARLPGIHLDRWALFTADDLVADGGLPELLHMLRAADVILVSNAQLNDVAVLATSPLAQAPPLTSHPALDKQTQLLGSDESTRTGSLADPLAPPGDPTVVESGTAVTVTRRRRLELWARVETSPTAAALTFSLDGRTLRRITPLSLHPGAFRWVRIAAPELSAGTHALRITAAPSRYGSAYELDEARFVVPARRAAALRALETIARDGARHIVYSLDVDDAQKWIRAGGAGVRPPELVSRDPATFWQALDPLRTRVVASPLGARVRFAGGRTFYSLLQHNFGASLDWSARQYVYLALRGTGGGLTYQVIVDFSKDHSSYAQFAVHDDSHRSRVLALAVAAARYVNAKPSSWKHVWDVRIATDEKTDSGRLLLGRFAISARNGGLVIAYPVAPVSANRVVSGLGTPLVLPAGSSRLFLIEPPSVIGAGLHAVVEPVRPLTERPPVAVHATRTGPTTWSVAFRAPERGALVFAQGFDPRWQLRGGSHAVSLPAFSVVNGYMLSAGDSVTGIRFTGQRYEYAGAGLSGLAVLVLLGAGGFVPYPGQGRRWATRSLRQRRPRRG